MCTYNRKSEKFLIDLENPFCIIKKNLTIELNFDAIENII